MNRCATVGNSVEKCRLGQHDGEPIGQFLWRILREAVRRTTKEVTRADEADIHMSHGIHHQRKVNHREPLMDVLYNNETEEYLTVDSHGICLYHKDGRSKGQIEPEEPIEKLVYANEVKRYVGWTTGEKYLKMFTKDFELISEAVAPQNICCALYNDQQNELVTAGQASIMSWCFRYGAKHLVPKKGTDPKCLTPDDVFTMMTLEKTASRSQRCFAVHNAGVAVFNLYEGTLLSYKKNLHVRNITSILFYNPLKQLLTGAKDGSIKTWDDSWHLLLVFIGHGGAVTSLCAYPYGPYILSASRDCTLRVWSLETQDKVDEIATDEPVEGLGTVLQRDNIYSFSTNTIDLWYLKHIHDFFTAIGSEVSNIMVTDHPNMPTRAVCVCEDSSVRLLTPGSGDILTSFLTSPQHGVLDAAYAAAENVLFVVCKTGDIIKADTTKNPAKVVRTWKHHGRDPKELLNTIALYEYVIESTPKAPDSHWSKGKSRNRTLLVGGRRDGSVAMLHWNSMEAVFQADAHGFNGVIGLLANPKNDQLISTGLDTVIRIWRVFPFAEECLAPLMSFYCALVPLHMAVVRTTLCVAFQDESSATYSIVHYNLQTKERNDHSPDSDHVDSITGLACNPRLAVFASASTDGTIKIWDKDNVLIRSIKLNAKPLSVNFCSTMGDLLIGIGNHIHRINHTRYLPRAYLRKMVSMAFPAVPAETPIPLDTKRVQAMSPRSNKRLKGAHSSVFRFDRFIDVLTEEETDELSRQRKLKDVEFTIIESREEELRKLRDGSFDFKTKKKSAALANKIKRDAFLRYWNIVHLDLDHDKIPSEDDFRPDAGDVDEESETHWQPNPGPSGFFPHPATAYRPKAPSPIFETQLREEDYEDGIRATHEPVQIPPGPAAPLPRLPINPSGFIPNSVLIRLLWPPGETNRMKEEIYKPPTLNEHQLVQIAKKRRPESMGSPERVMVWSDEEEVRANTPLVPGTSPQPEDSYTPKASLLDKFNIDIAPVPLEVPDITESTPTPPTTPLPEPQPEPPIKKPPKQPTRHPKVQKLPKPPVKEAPPKPVAPSQPTPTVVSPPPRPPTPLPSFISQFKGSSWFEEYFPNATDETFPKPWTVTAFISNLLRLLKIADYSCKTPILEAIVTLYQQEPVVNTRMILEVLMGVLNQTSPPTAQDADQKVFILMSLKALQAMSEPQTEMIVELIVQFLDGDKEIRELVHDIFLVLGLQDIHNYFFKELDGWDVWSVGDGNRKKELKIMARRWLEKWIMLFRSHLRKIIELLKKGKIAGNIQRLPADRQASPSSSESTAKGKSILRGKQEQAGDASKPTSSQSGGHSDVSSQAHRNSPAADSFLQTQQLTVTFDMAPELSTIDNAQPMEAINYFVEMEVERAVDRMRLATAKEQQHQEEPDDKKNTVLVLPQIRSKPSLVRLGETHTSRCRPHRETTLEADLRLPPIRAGKRPEYDGLYHFTTKIDFPMKTMYMNPFPSPIDVYDQLHQPILLTLKSAQKYFVPDQSVVREENFR